jgi:hypothetical protein
MSIDIKEKAAEVLEEGFCILPQHLPRELMQECNEAFAPILAEYASEITENPNRGPMRHYIPLPMRPPFYDKCIFDDDTIHAILTELLTEDIAMAQFASDTPQNGSVYQDVHADMAPLFPDAPALVHPPFLIAVNFPFVDVPPEKGPFEVARRSHLLPKEEALQKIEVGEIPLEPLLMQAGDVLIRNPACLHRGSPNRTDEPRPVAVIGCHRSWLNRYQRVSDSPMQRSVWDQLSERERKVLGSFSDTVRL